MACGDRFEGDFKETMEGEEERDGGCCTECRPHVFTSVLLGILACVLVTGGVFLAFHKWDHTWLLVSAVGVILIIIGTALHCCDSSKPESPRNGSQKGRPHVIPCGLDNGTLTEQLLPLSNARSVSQLSLNMVPAYFPTYGIEQHAAVVQNINHIVQGTGKSFLLLPIPGNANPAQLQNLMATVCQLDASASVEDLANVRDPPVTDISSQTTEISSPSVREASRVHSEMPSSTADLSRTLSSSSTRIVKNAEVQTCDNWSGVSNLQAQESDQTRTCNIEVSSDANDVQCQTAPTNEVETCALGASSEINHPPRNCEVACSTEDRLNVMSELESNTLIGNSLPVEVLPQQQPIYDIPVTVVRDSLQSPPSSEEEVSVPSLPSEDLIAEDAASSLLVDIVDVSSEERPTQSVIDSDSQLLNNSTLQPPATSVDCEQILLDIALPSATDDPSDSISVDVEDVESIERSSPPPSYDDVTQEGNQMSLGAFGLAYGTI